MITGDGNLVEMQATVRYTISDPHVYLFEVDDPPAVVRDAAESVLRDMVAGRTFADLLTRDREAFHTEALQRLRRALRRRTAARAGRAIWRGCRWPICTRRRRWWRRTIR